MSYTEEYEKPTTLKGKIENFWYHYKWHSIIALFLVFTIVICSVQMCQKEDYDVFILYAGAHDIKKTSDSDIPEYGQILSDLGRVTKDFDGNESVKISLKNLFMLSEEEIKEVEKSDEYEVNYSVIYENNEIFRETVMYSNYYLCFLSKPLYEQYKTIDGVNTFISLEGYKETKGVKLYDSYSIELSSLNFKEYPGMSSLPAEDTVVCIRAVTPIAAHFDEKGAKMHHQRAVDVLEEILKLNK